jgi:hypothetical protein
MAVTGAPENHSGMLALRVIAVAAAAFVLAAVAGATGPAPFHLVFDGHHNEALLHEGTFTTSSPWCSSGTAADVSVDSSTDTAVRRFSCAGGGDFTAKLTPLPAEHGGSGSWQIVDATGPLANLRGKGRFTSIRLSGSADDPTTITFRSTWDGAADFDATPPTIGARGTARRVTARANSFAVRVALVLADAAAPVSYQLQVVDPKRPTKALVFKLGETSTGSTTSSFRITVAKTTRTVRVEVTASDAYGNEATLAKLVRLR